MFLHRQLGVKSSTSYSIVQLEAIAQPIEALAMQRVYKYITKVKDMPHHRQPKQSWNMGCEVQKTKSKIPSCNGCLTL